MQVSIKWLKDYVDIDETAEEIADRLTMAGVPVERVVRADRGLRRSSRHALRRSRRIRTPIICSSVS